jgi:hypothetical protein
MIILGMWRIWRHHNDVVFHGASPAAKIVKKVYNEMTLGERFGEVAASKADGGSWWQVVALI